MKTSKKEIFQRKINSFIKNHKLNFIIKVKIKVN